MTFAFLNGLELLAGQLRLVLETLSVLCVLAGLLATLVRALTQPHRRPWRLRPSNGVRLTFGSWLAMALEFQLASDIVATTTAPTESNLIQLGVVAVIRTFLNFFLSKELEAERELEQRRSPDATS
ncbi:DUF1622 domain-containing protein [Synechococcus sp. CS-1329]|uniref:DUF1622 domain-containing protein n=1 Tax=Synechococcus sp. CS-1329 TaxID=2847975 RepID=UPI00223A8795|nr:DUF1622 domain-containing protein [Synechococcus sp. CS-1329]MCT0218295.1 DUF1622 domain-containing protein [Synechococcus sp. CS-1329]